MGVAQIVRPWIAGPLPQAPVGLLCLSPPFPLDSIWPTPLPTTVLASLKAEGNRMKRPGDSYEAYRMLG